MTGRARYRDLKRAVDFLTAFFLLLFLLPFFVLTGCLIRLDSPGPVFFRQKRVGKNETYFQIYKFRTMGTETPSDIPTHLLKEPGQYMTRIGRFLRKTSLDELPQLINVLKGEMSLVGPRPALWNQTDLLEERRKNGSIRLVPGITGLAQVNGRDRLSIKQKAYLDGVYARKQGPGTDLRILWKTLFHTMEG